jgi:SNF2-related domain/Helicase conserved C-terminal domain/Bacterial SNF2 helicase associated
MRPSMALIEAPEGDWIEALEPLGVRRLVGRRAFDLALKGRLLYGFPPERRGNAVFAALVEEFDKAKYEEAADERVRKALHTEVQITCAEGQIQGTCSRCMNPFGPCVHMGTVAVDLALSRRLRQAVLEGRVDLEAIARASAARFALNLELGFDASFEGWLAPVAHGQSVEISVQSVGHGDPYEEHRYGEHIRLRHDLLSISVRRRGEKKLIDAKEITTLTMFSARDRRVLQFVREDRAGKKGVFTAGVQSSLTLEAMRLHGGILGAGFRGVLDFRSVPVRPRLHLAEADPFAELTAFWETDDGMLSVPFADSAFYRGPFPYVWTRSGAIFPVVKDVDQDLVKGLVQRPMIHVPPSRLQDVGERLFRVARGRGISLPPHETFGLPPLETPRIVLRLAGDALDVKGELVAVYRAREIPLAGNLSGLPRARFTDDGRDLETEAAARLAIEGAGLVRPGSFLDEDDDPATYAANAIEDDEPVLRARELGIQDEAAIDFWQSGLLALRGLVDPPIEVELTQQLASIRIGEPLKPRVTIALEGDWLRTKLDFDSKDLPVELAAVRNALMLKRRWVQLSDGTLAKISASVAELAEEAGQVLGDTGDARLAPHQLGRLDRWVEENDGRIDGAVLALRRRLRALAVATEPDMPIGLNATLRPYQRHGLAWLQFLQALGAGGILADDMGLGKTITTLAFLLRRKEVEGPLPALVVCPTSVATNWLVESARFTPDLRVLLLHGVPKNARAARAARIEDNDLIVTTYALLRSDTDFLSKIKFRVVVLDEAQNIKNSDNATTRAANLLDASMRLALSGTPIENRLRELWSLASFANPGILGTSRAFETRYERPIASDRASPLATELRAVVRPFLLRRTKDDVLKELPPKTEMDRIVSMGVSEKRLYDALAHVLRDSLGRDFENKGAKLSLDAFTAMTRLRQMACDVRLIDPSLARTVGALVGNDEPDFISAKREAFLDLVHELVAEGRRALVFSQFVSLLTLWRKDLDDEGIPYEYLDGSTVKRDVVVKRFMEGRAPFFLISLKAGGSGLNLTAADTVIHCDPWWNPAVEDQATDRAYRIGQFKPVTVVRLVARGTIEEKILSLKEKKRKLAAAIIGDDAGALEGITADDIRFLLGDDVVPRGVKTEVPVTPSGDATEALATARKIVSPDYHAVVAAAQKWLAQTGRLETDLAVTVDIPPIFASRLARGEPFPCSRAVGDRIRARLSAWR